MQVSSCSSSLFPSLQSTFGILRCFNNASNGGGVLSLEGPAFRACNQKAFRYYLEGGVIEKCPHGSVWIVGHSEKTAALRGLGGLGTLSRDRDAGSNQWPKRYTVK